MLVNTICKIVCVKDVLIPRVVCVTHAVKKYNLKTDRQGKA